MRLRYGLVFPTACLSSPIRWFPLRCCITALPRRDTRLPLSPHCNPFSVSAIEQPRCFPPQSVRFFSLFCRTGFKERSGCPFRPERQPPLIPYPPGPRKAGYVCTQRYGPAGPMHRIAGSQSASYTGRKYRDGSTSVHNSRSPRKQGRVNHAIGKRPETASPAK